MVFYEHGRFYQRYFFLEYLEILKSDPIQEILDSDLHTVDTMCHCLDLCFVEENYDQVCHLFPLPSYANDNPNGKSQEF